MSNDLKFSVNYTPGTAGISQRLDTGIEVGKLALKRVHVIPSMKCKHNQY